MAKTQKTAYTEAVEIAKALIEPDAQGTNRENREYREYVRGIVEFIADAYSLTGIYLAERKEEVARDIGIDPALIA